MKIPQPYLLFLGDVTDPLAAKTARGIQYWRPEQCIAEIRLPGCSVSLGLEEMSVEQAALQGAKTLVLGTANAGGFLPEHWLPVIRAAIEAGMNVASGLHQRLGDVPGLTELANHYQVSLFDIRHTETELTVGTGKKRTGKRVLTVGTDCSVGKMYTSLALESAMRAQGMNADFRATGQTGIFIAGNGIAIDAVIADFIAGAAELLSPANTDDHWDIIEGQGSLFHPAYAGVSLGLLQGAQPHWLVMCHEMGRTHMRHLPHIPMVDPEDCLAANLQAGKVTSDNVRLAGFSVNTSNFNEQEAKAYLQDLSQRFGVPATDPVRFGITEIAALLKERG
ncbi:N-acetyltransferase DgcN [Tatumella ptyseos]|uniref:EBNA-1 family protein n=2 Tax=Tatumella ptyseos TaxID=82987 RepID=A0A085JQH9_9GAMM|nr:N-acetyltransferase DgcN [Tatumella ptyseos]KFD22725.1 EBNA-1 family protein [Tatumella ptyseos ATCC 33301]SQK71859.1 Protein of uncharacterised function (DUF1611) [Tatumella ptyseos]